MLTGEPAAKLGRALLNMAPKVKVLLSKALVN